MNPLDFGILVRRNKVICEHLHSLVTVGHTVSDGYNIPKRGSAEFIKLNDELIINSHKIGLAMEEEQSQSAS